MRVKVITACLLAGALSAMTASAHLSVFINCPSGLSQSGIRVNVYDSANNLINFSFTDEFGVISGMVLNGVGTYNVCVDVSTLPSNATIDSACKSVTLNDVDDEITANFTLGGAFCQPVTGAFCWETGGGTIGKNKKATYTFGGVIYPGCSSKSADGGNLNVVDHSTGIHFQGQHIVVDDCTGVSTKSPKVTVNIIDFHGDGIVTGIAGNDQAKVSVTFSGTAIDNHDGGAGADQLLLNVSGGYLTIDDGAGNPVDISTGNIQIHQTSCSSGKP